eukprot:TRINITY_DN11251_c0_g1_i1.p2 TRINITY_DN11251_c0_g1~~TRINITY_DN11251_c0_g1_i1.p2  ORF type:complete len:136 (+),score=34.82 TRINITY_DN11251_c0_g1_i1:42-449(+)
MASASSAKEKTAPIPKFPARNQRLQGFALELAPKLSALLSSIVTVTKNVMKGTQHEETIVRCIKWFSAKEAICDATASTVADSQRKAESKSQEEQYQSIKAQLAEVERVNQSLNTAVLQIRSLFLDAPLPPKATA